MAPAARSRDLAIVCAVVRPFRRDAGSLLAVAGALLVPQVPAAGQTTVRLSSAGNADENASAGANTSVEFGNFDDIWADDDAKGKDKGEPAYADKLIAGGSLAPDTERVDEPERKPGGRIRSLVAELGGTLISPRTRIEGLDTNGADRVQREVGLSLSGRTQTDNWGTLGIDGELWWGSTARSLPGSPNKIQGTLALSDRRFSLGKGWLADATVGTLSAPVLGLMNLQPRFYMPATPLLGANLVVNRYRPIDLAKVDENPQPTTTVNFALGEPGLFGGLRLGNFTGLSGIAATGGAQTELTPTLTGAFQAIALENSRDPYGVIFGGAGGAAPTLSSRAGLASIAWRAPGWRLQANAIVSDIEARSSSASFLGSNGIAAGAWIDGSRRSGRTTQTGGLYYFAPNLAWGSAAVISNAWGGYYRYSTASQRWRWTGSVDAVRSVDGKGTDGLLLTADARRQLTFTTDVGINSAVRASQGEVSAQVLGYVDFTNRFGATRAEVGWSRVPTYDLYRLSWNQNWKLPPSLPAGARLTTQIAFDHRRETQSIDSTQVSPARGSTNSVSIGLNAGANPFSGVGFDASVVYSNSASSLASSIYGPVDAGGGVLSMLSTQSGRTLTANITASARLSSKWSLIASFINTRSNTLSRYGLSDPSQSPIGTLPGDLNSRQKSTFRLVAGYLTLRYSMSAGSAIPSNGLTRYPYAGTGELVGRVYLDANGNRRRDPDEKGAPGVLVFIDGIQGVRTDENGYYRFDHVAEGAHRITLNADALPLPWTIVLPDAPGGRGYYLQTVDVGVRRVTELDIAAARE